MAIKNKTAQKSGIKNRFLGKAPARKTGNKKHFPCKAHSGGKVTHWKSIKESIGETLRGIIGEALLFVFTAAMVAAVVTLLAMLESKEPEKEAVIAALYTLIAGALYTTRTHLEEGKWKKLTILSVTTLILIVLSLVNVTHKLNIELSTTVLGSTWVVLAAAFLTVIPYAIRLKYLFCKWLTKRRIKELSRTENHKEAVEIAEQTTLCLSRPQNYIKNPAEFSSYKSAALALAKSLDAVNRPHDATRVRLVTNGWTNGQANAYLDEQEHLNAVRRLKTKQPSNEN